jgi:hypothetical protein
VCLPFAGELEFDVVLVTVMMTILLGVDGDLLSTVLTMTRFPTMGVSLFVAADGLLVTIFPSNTRQMSFGFYLDLSRRGFSVVPVRRRKDTSRGSSASLSHAW